MLAVTVQELGTIVVGGIFWKAPARRVKKAMHISRNNVNFFVKEVLSFIVSPYHTYEST